MALNRSNPKGEIRYLVSSFLSTPLSWHHIGLGPSYHYGLGLSFALAMRPKGLFLNTASTALVHAGYSAFPINNGKPGGAG